MQSKNNSLVNSIEENYPDKPGAYSVYFEVHLERDDFGKDRKKHDAICNQQLVAHLEMLNAEGVELCEIAKNAALQKLLKKIYKSLHIRI